MKLINNICNNNLFEKYFLSVSSALCNRSVVDALREFHSTNDSTPTTDFILSVFNSINFNWCETSELQKITLGFLNDEELMGNYFNIIRK